MLQLNRMWKKIERLTLIFQNLKYKKVKEFKGTIHQINLFQILDYSSASLFSAICKALNKLNAFPISNSSCRNFTDCVSI